MVYEVFGCFCNNFGDKEIDSFKFDTKDCPDAKHKALKYLVVMREKRYEPNEYQKKMKYTGSKYYYHTGIETRDN